MRNAFCSTLVELADNPDFVFLTGDLGFQALEPLRQRMGGQFINAGIAEQKPGRSAVPSFHLARLFRRGGRPRCSYFWN